MVANITAALAATALNPSAAAIMTKAGSATNATGFLTTISLLGESDG